MKNFEQDLSELINKHALEAEFGNTPDFVLAKVAIDALISFAENASVRDRLKLNPTRADQEDAIRGFCFSGDFKHKFRQMDTALQVRFIHNMNLQIAKGLRACDVGNQIIFDDDLHCADGLVIVDVESVSEGLIVVSDISGAS